MAWLLEIGTHFRCQIGGYTLGVDVSIDTVRVNAHTHHLMHSAVLIVDTVLMRCHTHTHTHHLMHLYRYSTDGGGDWRVTQRPLPVYVSAWCVCVCDRERMVCVCVSAWCVRVSAWCACM